MGHVQKLAYTSRKTGKTTNTWQARYTAPDGRERTKRFARKVDAERWLDTNGADIARGQWFDPEAGKQPFRSYAEDWLTTKADVAPRTRINIEGRLENHALPHFGDQAMSAIRPADVRAFVAKLTLSGLAPSTVRATYRTVSQIFAQAAIDKVVPSTPCVTVKLPKDSKQDEMHFLTAEQVNDLADAIEGRYRALVYTAAYGGLRAGELVAVKVERLELGELGGTIAVTGAASEVRGELVFGTTKTGRKRTVPIPRFLSAMLSEHLEQYGSPGGFVFTAPGGGPIRHRNFYRRQFQPAVTKARKLAIEQDREDDAIPANLRFHDLRHTCAAMLIANGRHMEEVKDHLGHSSIRVTSDRYGHLFPSTRKERADALEATFAASRARAETDERRTKFSVVTQSEEAAGPSPGPSLERTTGFEPATLTLAR
jgi:integrase